MKYLRTFSLLWIFGISLESARAAVIFVAPTVSATGTLMITEDITFNITWDTSGGSGGATGFLLDDWVVSDGGANSSLLSPNLLYSVNGGSTSSVQSRFLDNFARSDLDMTPGDGLISPNLPLGIPVTLGDTVTLLTGTYTLSAVSGFNPLATQTFTGSMYVVDGAERRISNIVQVPEPSGMLIFMTGVGMFVGVRRRFKAVTTL